jgi:hypothetical protein
VAEDAAILRYFRVPGPIASHRSILERFRRRCVSFWHPFDVAFSEGKSHASRGGLGIEQLRNRWSGCPEVCLNGIPVPDLAPELSRIPFRNRLRETSCSCSPPTGLLRDMVTSGPNSNHE